MNEIKRFDVFTDYICPFCYLNIGRIEQLEAEYPVRANWRCFPLHPEVPPEGASLVDLFHLTPEKVEAMGERFKETAASVGLPFGDIRMVYNSRMAQEVGLWAADQGKGEAFHMAGFQAYFVRQENIAERNVILDLADAVGLSADEAAAVMDDRRYKAAVDRDWAKAEQLEIDLIPTVVVGDLRQGGFQPYARFEALMKNAGIARR